MPQLHESGPFQGSYGQPRETTQYRLGPIWATFRYVAPRFFIFRRTPSKLRQISFIEMRIYFSGLILRNIPNSITPQTTLRLLPIAVGLLVLPCTRQCRRSPSLFLTCRRPVGYLCPWQACATTACPECAR